MWLAQRASRDTGAIDRLCRRLLDRAVAPSADDAFMRDDWVDNDEGFDPDELDRYQRGSGRGREPESIDPTAGRGAWPGR